MPLIQTSCSRWHDANMHPHVVTQWRIWRQTFCILSAVFNAWFNISYHCLVKGVSLLVDTCRLRDGRGRWQEIISQNVCQLSQSAQQSLTTPPPPRYTLTPRHAWYFTKTDTMQTSAKCWSYRRRMAVRYHQWNSFYRRQRSTDRQPLRGTCKRAGMSSVWHRNGLSAMHRL